ncbi:MAG: thymidine phosphorylase, partial [Paracoccaceae bacterium]
ENWQRFLPEASVIHEVLAPKDGVITAWDCEALGLAVVALGGGRQVESDPIDPAVGLSDVCALGSKVTKGAVIARVHASRVKTAEAASATVLKALGIGKSAAKQQDLVLDRVD